MMIWKRLLPAILYWSFATLSAACATTGAVPHPFPSPDWDGTDSSASSSSGSSGSSGAPSAPGAPVAPPSLTSRRFDGRAVALAALGFRGVPYRLGGATPVGFDCSGLVQYVFAQYGVDMPRVVEQQWRAGAKVKPSNIKPGDLLFFATKGPGATHVAIAVGDDRFVHAPTSSGVVRVEALSSGYWGPRYVGARRISHSTNSN